MSLRTLVVPSAATQERRVATMQKVLVKQDAAVRELQARVSEVRMQAAGKQERT